ncbi:MAG TPA: thiamine phosphate synthase [Candidatus Hypogeohydataceae bacterium YC38]
MINVTKGFMNREDLRKAIRQARLYVLLTQEFCKRPLLEVARLVIAGGADALQLREKGLQTPGNGMSAIRLRRSRFAHPFGEPEEGLLQLALELRKITRESNTLFIVNDSPHIALEVQADGLHLGQEDVPIKEARRLLGRDRLIGVSVHSIDQARKAQEEGADYLGVGPVFPTQTKALAGAVGLELLRQVSQEIQIPYFAIGGINNTNLEQVLSTGTRRVAICSAIIAQEDILASTQSFTKRLCQPKAYSK